MFSEEFKITKLYQGAANSIDADIIHMGDFHSGAFVCIHTGLSDTDLTLSVYEATDVAGATNRAIQVNVPILADTDMGTSSDVLVRQDDGKSYVIDTGEAPNSMVVFEVDASKLSDGYPCVYLSASGGNASNDVTLFWLGKPRYAGATLPSAIS